MKESYFSYVHRWNYWRKWSHYSTFFKFLVLIKVIVPPSLKNTIPIELPKRKKSR